MHFTSNQREPVRGKCSIFPPLAFPCLFLLQRNRATAPETPFSDELKQWRSSRQAASLQTDRGGGWPRQPVAAISVLQLKETSPSSSHSSSTTFNLAQRQLSSGLSTDTPNLQVQPAKPAAPAARHFLLPELYFYLQPFQEI